VYIGTWTLPYTLITQTLGEPTPYRYINLKTYAHISNVKHGALLARAAADGAPDSTFRKKHTSLTHIQFTRKQEFIWGVHNTRLLPHNPTLRCLMCGQFTSNGHMAGNCPSMSSL
jgi:hypothetical protein